MLTGSADGPTIEHMFDDPSATNESPAARAFEADAHALQQDIAELMGVINAAHGRLVNLVADGLAKDLWRQPGIHSPAHWLGWQAGLTPAHADGIVRLATRRHEVPATVDALAHGTLTLDAAVVIARRAPVGYDASITDFATLGTIGQLTRTLARYRYDPDTEQDRPVPRQDRRSFTSGRDDQGWWCKARLSPDEGAVVDQAIRTARDDRYRALDHDRPDHVPAPQVSLADGFLAVGEAALAHGAAAHPGSDRYLVHLHLDASPTPDDPTGVLSLHLGQPLPAALQGLLLCDATLRPIFERHGTPISIGRTTRVINRRTRRAIEHRDGGCRVPGCGQTYGLDIHHITHWEDHGSTDTDNLVTLCRRHHRLHHQGHLGIAGNPDQPTTTDPTADGLRFTDAHGRPLDLAGHPVPKHPRQTAIEAAAAHGIAPAPDTYRHPLGEHLQPGAVHFSPNHLHRPPPDRATRPPAGSADGPPRPPTPSPPRSGGPTGSGLDPADTPGRPPTDPLPGAPPVGDRADGPRGSPRPEAA